MVNMALSQLFWDVLMPWNLKSTYFSLKIRHFLSLNIWYIIYVVFWIKYWNLKLPHHCILFLFKICTVSQLFGIGFVHCFMVAFVVRFSTILFCDIWSWFSTQKDPFILKHYPLIVTVIVYGVPIIEVSVFTWIIIILNGHIILKG